MPSLWQTGLLVQHQCQFENRCVPRVLAHGKELVAVWSWHWEPCSSTLGHLLLTLRWFIVFTPELRFVLTRPCCGSQSTSTAESLSTRKCCCFLCCIVLFLACPACRAIRSREKGQNLSRWALLEVHCSVCLPSNASLNWFWTRGHSWLTLTFCLCAGCVRAGPQPV